MAESLVVVAQFMRVVDADRQKYNIGNILFFGGVFITTLIGIPWYAKTIGFTRFDWILGLVFALATGLSITVGYHRLLAHRAFRTNRVVTFLCIFFGAAAFEQTALMWTSQHRDHHRFVDTPRDPYNIRQGFWHAHMGWMLVPLHKTDYSNVKDLSANALIMHQYRHYFLWALTAGVALPLMIGLANGHFWGAFFLAVCGRLTFVHHTTFSINSFCHSFGKATYDNTNSARDSWLVALLTNGEGYHNFHHRFPSDFRNGVRWYHWDPSKWLIALLGLCGLAKNLCQATPQAILSARARTEHSRVEQAISIPGFKDGSAIRITLAEHYDRLKNALHELEHCEKEYHRMRELVTQKSRAYIRTLKQQLKEKRQVLALCRREWKIFINTHPLIPNFAHV